MADFAFSLDQNTQEVAQRAIFYVQPLHSVLRCCTAESSNMKTHDADQYIDRQFEWVTCCSDQERSRKEDLGECYTTKAHIQLFMVRRESGISHAWRDRTLRKTLIAGSICTAGSMANYRALDCPLNSDGHVLVIFLQLLGDYTHHAHCFLSKRSAATMR